MKTIKQSIALLGILCMIVVTVLLLMIAACSKSNSITTYPNNTGNAYLAVVNASPGTTAYTVYAGATNIYPGNTLAYGSVTSIAGGSPYEQINSGIDTIKLSANGTTYPVDTAFNFNAPDNYTLFAYDTTGSSGKLKTLILQDNITPPSANEAEVRFINLSPSTMPLTVWLVNADTAMKDTVSFTNISYVGSLATVSPDSLAAFNNITPGMYTIYLNTNPGSKTPLTTDTISFATGGIYTIYAKGYANGLNGTDSLGVGVVKHL